MDSSNCINGCQLENIDSPIDEILQSIFGEDEEDSKIIAPNELLSMSTDNGSEDNFHYFKKTNNSIQSSNSIMNTNPCYQISSPSYLEYSSPELTFDKNQQPDPSTNLIPIPIASIPPDLTHQTLPKMLPSDHTTQAVYIGIKRK